MRILLAGALTAAALLTAAPSMAQNYYGPGFDFSFGVGPGYYGGGYYGPGYYGNDYGPSYGYGPGYGYDYTYSQPGPVYEGRSAAVEPGASSSADVSYCEQRFRSYNPSTGMYLGYDGQYHPCP